MEDFKKEINLNKKILVILIMLCILTIGTYSSYALFQTTVKTDKPVININTGSELPTSGPIMEGTIEGLAKVIVDKAYSSDKEIIAINQDGDKCQSLNGCKVREFRFSGLDVNNYIYLKDNSKRNEMWRIVGVFYDEDKKEWYTKILRNKLLPEDYFPNSISTSDGKRELKGTCYALWNRSVPYTGEEQNDWSVAGVQYYLNSVNYLNYLSSDTKLLLVEKTLFLGTVTYLNGEGVSDTTKEAYKYERATDCTVGKITSRDGFTGTEKCRVWDNHAATWTGKVSLLYPSDYGYSADSKYWDNTMLYDYDEAATTSWMDNTMDHADGASWLFSPTSINNQVAVDLSDGGGISGHGLGGYYVNGGCAMIRPVLNIDSKTNIKSGSGSGTEASPYIIV